MVEGGMKLIKYLIFIFNLIFWISGIGIISVGAYLQVKIGKYFSGLSGGYTSIPVLLIIVGCIVAIIGFFGCCGAIKENYCMIITFAVLLGTIFILEIAAGIAAYVLRKEVNVELQRQFNESLSQYNESIKDSPVTIMWNDIQIHFNCCGVVNSSDWYSHGYNSTHLPDSCCSQPERCGNSSEKPLPYNSKPCLKELLDLLLHYINIIIGVGIGIAFIQVFGIILACCLGRAIRKEYEVV